MAGPAFVPPKWRKPAPLGYGNAIDSVGTVGSALLAGFSLASVIVVTSAAGQFRWPGAAVLALATAAVVLIASVQFTYNTRQFLWSGADVHGWWPELQENSELETRLREEQAESFGRWQAWARWTRAAHGAGVLILLAGLAVALPPPRGAQGGLRWGAFCVAAAGCAGEAVWMAAWYGRRSRQARPPVPEGTCPVCQLSIRHDQGCPYEGLSMPQAWARYRQDSRPPADSGPEDGGQVRPGRSEI
ncbi:MAG TPA: hypothetical protein VGI05_03830 [Streptosporangiaceae bacterium]